MTIYETRDKCAFLPLLLIACLDEAERHLFSARNWGFLDVLGGGIFVDLVKHSKLNSASAVMDKVNYLMGELRRVMGSIALPADYRMKIGGFETFADFFFDSAFVDVYMTAKIMSSLTEVRNLKTRCHDLRTRLGAL